MQQIMCRHAFNQENCDSFGWEAVIGSEKKNIA
jgi:hypothetical protein